MKVKNFFNSQTFHVILILFWASLFQKSDSFYFIYVMIAIFGSIATFVLPEKLPKNRLALIFGSIFSAMVVLANYSCLAALAFPRWLMVPIIFGGAFCAGAVIGRNILLLLEHYAKKSRVLKPKLFKLSPVQTFFIFWVIILTVYLLVFFVALYPGCYSFDSNMQLGQVVSGEYTNHHPFYHTLLIKIFYDLGLRLFSGDANAALACYTVFQIFVLSACFAYMLSTLMRLKVSKYWIAICLLLYALLPYHIIYSATIWKDVLFGGFVLVLATSSVRVLYHLGVPVLNYILLAIGALGCGLFRSNGFLVLAAFSAIMAALFWSARRSFWAVLVSAAAVAFILKGPVLGMLGVKPVDTIESLSIPTQQVARVIYEADDLTPDERELLSNIVEIDEIPKVYDPELFDPVKELVRRNDQTYLKEHFGEFLGLYLELGLRHPAQYLKAWIDQTRGFWNGGYDSYVWTVNIYDNNYGISRESSVLAQKLNDHYSQIFKGGGMLSVFVSTGFMTWLLMAMLYLELRRKNLGGITIILLPILIIGTLLIATPVSTEFRYAYAIYTTAPLTVCVAFSGKRLYNRNITHGKRRHPLA